MRRIYAAGGVVWRLSDNGVEVVLVHRPRRRDWTLPKGKLDPGELTLTAACREVREETGMQVAPQNHLSRVRYPMQSSDGTALKIVDYWVMRLTNPGFFVPHDEIDDVRWLPVDRALDLLDYPRDITLVTDFAAQSRISGIVLLLPIRENSQDTDTVTSMLSLYEPERITLLPPAPRRRALEKLASLQGVPLSTHPMPAEGGSGAIDLIREHAAEYPASIVSVDQKMAPKLVAQLIKDDGITLEDVSTVDTAVWVLGFAGSTLLTVDQLQANGAPL